MEAAQRDGFAVAERWSTSLFQESRLRSVETGRKCAGAQVRSSEVFIVLFSKKVKERRQYGWMDTALQDTPRTAHGSTSRIPGDS